MKSAAMIDPVPPLFEDLKVAAYLGISAMLGLFSALAALMGNEEKKLTWRIVVAYLGAGALVAGGVTLLLIERYGFSYPLLGVSIFAGYKAFDILAAAGIALAGVVKKIIGLFASTKP